MSGTILNERLEERYDVEVLSLEGYEVLTLTCEASKTMYWTQWYYSDTNYWTAEFTNDYATCHRMFLGGVTEFPLPIRKVALLRMYPTDTVPTIIDCRYN